MITQQLTQDRLAGLVRTGSVHRAHLTPYPADDGGGWYLDIDHADGGLSRHLHSQRGGLRVFRTADAAIKALHDCGHTGSVVVVMRPPGA